MPIFKVTMEFNSPRGGWSESLYFDNAGVSSVADRMDVLTIPRMGCSPPSVVMVGFRVAQWPTAPKFFPTPRVGQFFPRNVQGTQGGATSLPDSLALKVVLIARGTNGHTRFIDVGGLADSQTLFNAQTGVSTMGPFLGGAIEVYKNLLVGTGCAIWADIPPTTDGYQQWNVVNVEGSGVAGPQMTVTTANAHGMLAGDFCTFGRVDAKLFPGLKGNWPVLVATNTSIIIPYYNNFPATLVTTVGRLRVRKLGKLYDLISQATFDGLRTHKVGRVFTQSRGRAKAVSFRQ